MTKSQTFHKTIHGALFCILGLHYGSYALATGDNDAETTDETAKKINVTPDQLHHYARSPFLILDPKNTNTHLFFALSRNEKPPKGVLYGQKLNAAAPATRRDEFLNTPRNIHIASIQALSDPDSAISPAGRKALETNIRAYKTLMQQERPPLTEKPLQTAWMRGPLQG